eukprot:6098934-Pyramimonas_sp.AAC.1
MQSFVRRRWGLEGAGGMGASPSLRDAAGHQKAEMLGAQGGARTAPPRHRRARRSAGARSEVSLRALRIPEQRC